MLQSPIKPPTYSLRADRTARTGTRKVRDEEADMEDQFDDDDDFTGEGGGKKGKSRRELPTGAVSVLKAWLLSPEHFTHPYPTPQDQAMLMQKTGIDKKQLKNWFTNARRRIWKPMLKKQIEEGKLGAAGVTTVAGLISTESNPHSVQAMRVHYQQASQDVQMAAAAAAAQQQQQVQKGAPLDAFVTAAIYSAAETGGQYYGSSDSQQNLATCNSIGTLAQISSSAQLSKTDSHAVLMELFARDQDLVRQATESARLKAEKQQAAATQGQPQQGTQSSQHPMANAPSQSGFQSVPSLSSWPHFSSITSLNNLGSLPGVKSIASMSGQDLASKGSVNRMGNLAQVKSMESLGKNDSYAFLEVFFGDRSSTNLSGMGGGTSTSGTNPKSMLHKPSGDEDNEIGLSLDDESPAHPIKNELLQSASPQVAVTNSASSIGSLGQGQGMGMPDSSSVVDDNSLKRAYDDALAARGLISVSKSCEKLTELPAKIQRTLSQTLLDKEQRKQFQEQSGGSYTPYSGSWSKPSTDQYPGEQPVEPQMSSNGNGVRVASNTACALCNQISADTQLGPCGHMFHDCCLQPSIKNPVGSPKCPVDGLPIESFTHAVPDNTTDLQPQKWSYTKSQSLQEADAS